MTNPIEQPTETLRSRIADYTIGLAIALFQSRRAGSTNNNQPRTHKPRTVVLAPVFFPARCASCGVSEGLPSTRESDDSGVVFCRDCLDQVGPVDFPEYYRDLGEVD